MPFKLIYMPFNANYSRPFSNIEEDLEDIEYDNPDLHHHMHLDAADLKQEAVSVYQQVKQHPVFFFICLSVNRSPSRTLCKGFFTLDADDLKQEAVSVYHFIK